MRAFPRRPRASSMAQLKRTGPLLRLRNARNPAIRSSRRRMCPHTPQPTITASKGPGSSAACSSAARGAVTSGVCGERQVCAARTREATGSMPEI